MSSQTLLYTEMVTARAVVHGDRQRLLGYDDTEHPVALQLGGSEPEVLAEAVRVACDFGYDEINLNVGCPSDRVKSGSFGAVLMERADVVATCCDAMIAASSGAEITVKCRIGVDDQVPAEILPAFLKTVHSAGVNSFTIHARMAWLQGLSPKENRDVPPLDYDLVRQMKAQFPALEIAINGGITSLDEVDGFLADGLDGVMIGRVAYHDPAAILLEADERIFGITGGKTRHQITQEMLPYIEQYIHNGGRLNHITRHMLGLFTGQPGARAWRRHLSENAHVEGAGIEVVIQALTHVT